MNLKKLICFLLFFYASWPYEISVSLRKLISFALVGIMRLVWVCRSRFPLHYEHCETSQRREMTCEVFSSAACTSSGFSPLRVWAFGSWILFCFLGLSDLTEERNDVWSFEQFSMHLLGIFSSGSAGSCSGNGSLWKRISFVLPGTTRPHWREKSPVESWVVQPEPPQDFLLQNLLRIFSSGTSSGFSPPESTHSMSLWKLISFVLPSTMTLMRPHRREKWPMKSWVV